MKRYLEKFVKEDLKEKMVFIGGPRQVGKTYLSFNLLPGGNENHPGYLNWDDQQSRKLLLQGALPSRQKLIILDEIHKYKGWRNLVKGFYDKNKSRIQFLVTGSARLDYYRRGGDSLQGRFYYYRLHPFSLYELNKNPTKSDLETLLQYGGFPEPFLKANARHYKRWQKNRHTRVIQEDLINLESIREISQISLLLDVLPDRVGSPLSINNLKQDLSVAFETTEKWVQILENLYFCFRINPYGLPQLRAAKKEKKLYMWDWSLCENPSAKFENIVASHLLKYCHKTEDYEGDDMQLSFLRDSMRREIDFIVLKNNKPLFAVECKTGDQGLSKNISYFSKHVPVSKFYQVHLGTRDYEIKEAKTRVLPFLTFCKELEL